MKNYKVFFIESSCCATELNNLFTPIYDLERFGIKRTGYKEANIFIISGFSNNKYIDEVVSYYNKLENKPKVLAIGGCSKTGPLNAKSLDIKIDLFIPGCPPTPALILEGILRLAN
jgi:NADH-quinone oxidoreductase subunit B